MSKSFWEKLETPIVGLAPMDGVTDAATRFMVAKYGRPSVIYSEFVSVDAIRHGKRGVLAPFIYSEIERPVVAQVFGHDPELFYQASVVVAELGFDGMDINMGCPARKVSGSGSGAGLIRTPEKAQEVILQAKKGMKDWVAGKVGLDDLELSADVREWVKDKSMAQSNTKELLPVSVKTRIGVEEDQSRWWMEVLSEVKPAVITVHGRTLGQGYRGRADWEALGRAAKIVHEKGGIFLGNGDVIGLNDAEEKARKYGVDGVLIGRASFGNPGVFRQTEGSDPSVLQKMEWMIEHARKYEEIFQGEKLFFPMRKHLAWYCKGFSGASEMRSRLMQCDTAIEVESVVLGSV